MEYKDPLDERQLQHALGRLRQFKAYLRSLREAFPPRDIVEERLLRRARKCVENFAASARARHADSMNEWTRRADGELWEYWIRRRE